MKKKNSKVKKVILIALSLVLLTILVNSIIAVAVFGDKIANAMSVKKLQERLYYIDIKGDCGFENYLSLGGAESEAELAQYIISYLSGGFYEPEVEGEALDFGCSTLTVESSADEILMGRNFDWEGTEGSAMIIHSTPDDGYESYSTTWLDFLGFGEKWLPEGFVNQYMSLATFYTPLDGINEKGLCVADLVAGDKAHTNQDTTKTDLTTTTAIRLLLNEAATVEEAVQLLSEYDMNSSINTSHHLAISDATGRSVVVEYVDNEMIVTDTPAVTNHYLSQGEKHGVGNEESHNRFDKLIDMSSDIFDSEDMADCMESVSYPMETQWSIVYNLDSRSLDFYWQRDFSKPLNFSISK